MNKTTRTHIILLIIGLVAGIVGGLFGIGGGSLIVPGLVFFLALPQHKAHGTSLVSALALGASGVAAYYWRGGNVDFTLAAQIAAGAVVGAIIGGRFAGKLDGNTLRRVFGAFLVAVATWMIISGVYSGDPASVEPHRMTGQMATLAVVATGLLTGFMSALLGIGGGLVMIPAMVLLLGVPQKIAQGVSLATIIPTAFVGILIHRGMGNVDLRVGTVVSLGAIAGAQIGGAVAVGLEAGVLRVFFGVFLAIVAGLMAKKKQERR